MGDTTFPRRHFRARHLRGTRMWRWGRRWSTRAEMSVNQKMIDSEKLLSDYTIKHSSYDRIDLRWENKWLFSWNLCFFSI
jgi:hypothetical protein